MLVHLGAHSRQSLEIWLVVLKQRIEASAERAADRRVHAFEAGVQVLSSRWPVGRAGRAFSQEQVQR